MSLGDLGEFGLIRRIADKVAAAPGVALGIGDDCAALLPTPGRQLLTTSDMLVEGVHFDLAWSDPFTLGRKTLAVNLSDVAAMGGVPRWFLLSLALPSELSLPFLDDFTRGILSMAEEFGVALVGGDTCASRQGFVVSVTLMGEQLPERVVTRGGARAGDLVCVSGFPGDSALGLAKLRRGERGEGTLRHLDPLPRVSAGLALAEAGIPTAMIDISDGIAADLGHILERSGISGARIDAALLPFSPLFKDEAPRYGDPLALALSGGEDYELLFTLPPAKKELLPPLAERLALPLTVIGEIDAGAGVRVATPEGEYRPTSAGYDHFSGC